MAVSTSAVNSGPAPDRPISMVGFTYSMQGEPLKDCDEAFAVCLPLWVGTGDGHNSRSCAMALYRAEVAAAVTWHLRSLHEQLFSNTGTEKYLTQVQKAATHEVRVGALWELEQMCLQAQLHYFCMHKIGTQSSGP